MAAIHHGEAPKLGATYAPGSDEYYGMPGILSPGLPLQQTDYSQPSSQIHEQMGDLSLASYEQESTSDDAYNYTLESVSNFEHTPNQEAFPPRSSSRYSLPQPPQSAPTFTQPSIFPRLNDRPPNVPPSSDEQETILENARAAVLNSPNPDVQLMWAEHALAHVETCIEDERRQLRVQLHRPPPPIVVKQLQMDAINIVNFLANQEHPKAVYMTGLWQEFGKFGYAQNKAEAFKSYKRAAAKGFARAEYRMGMQFESTHETAKALQHYKQGERLGDAASCYRMAMIALLGQLGQPQDCILGSQLIQHAANVADENAPQGPYVLGMLLARELPQVQLSEALLPFDLDAARMYTEKSAFLGFSKAQLKMGTAYELCTLGCDFNPGLSLHYNELAARQGEAEAELAISRWFLCGYDPVFSRDDQTAFEYAHRAALSGLHMAEFAMGYFHEIGIFVSIDLDKAREWYAKAAKRGNKDAAARIAELSLQRTLSKKEHENVAITRIRSQHGSRRGGRPERFSRASTIMPTIPDDSSVHLADAHIFSKPTGFARMVGSSPVVSAHAEIGRASTLYPSYDDKFAARSYQTTESVTEADTLTVVAPDRKPSPQLDLRSNSPGPAQLQQPITSNTPPPTQRVHTPTPLNQQWTSTTLPPVPTPPRSLSPTRKPVPNRTQPLTPSQSRTASPAPPKLPDLGFASPFDPLKDQRLASYQLQEPVKNQDNRLSKLSFQSVESTNPQIVAGSFGPSIPDISRTATPPVRSDSPASQSSRSTFSKPARGPATFEEMGVPMAKQEQDCIMM